jgi:hypothetical protein
MYAGPYKEETFLLTAKIGMPEGNFVQPLEIKKIG